MSATASTPPEGAIDAPLEIHAQISDRKRWLAMGTILVAQFMNLIDVTIVNVALPSMQKGLGATESQIEWIVAGYILVVALMLLPMGRYGDIVGRKRLFLLGVTGFTLASAWCGFAGSADAMIVSRLFQGAAGGVMMPQVMAIAQELFEPKKRAGAFALFGLTAGLASVTGPILGGSLVTADLFGLGWRPIFLINLPIGIFCLIAGARLLPDMPGNKALRNDWIGILFVAAAMIALVFPLVEGRSFDWPLWCFVMMAASVPLFVGFFFWEMRQERLNRPQLLPISLLRAWNFSVGASLTMVYFSALPAMFLVLALFLQAGFGFDALHSGLTTVPFPLGVLLGSIASSRLGARWLKERIVTGLVLMFCGIFWLRLEVISVGDVVDHWALLPPLLIAGIGLALSIAPLFQTILAGVPVRDAGAGSGALQAIQQAGGALGIAIVSQIFFSSVSTGMQSGLGRHSAFQAAMTDALIYNLCAYAFVAVGALLLRRPAYSEGQDPNAPVLIE
ncbi:MAG: EmrB/QacA subfamily drug resistance transporter [Halocynthiibacter sp.]|jgi:EmrB/QacA subfamily drug resistance transporter